MYYLSLYLQVFASPWASSSPGSSSSSRSESRSPTDSNNQTSTSQPRSRVFFFISSSRYSYAALRTSERLQRQTRNSERLIHFTCPSAAAEVRQGQVPPQTVAKAPLPNLRPGVHLRAMRTRELPPPGSDHLDSNPVPEFDEGVKSYIFFRRPRLDSEFVDLDFDWSLVMRKRIFVGLSDAPQYPNQRLFWTIFGGQQNSAAVVLVSPLKTNGWTMWYFAVSAWPLAMTSLLSILELFVSEESGQLSSTSMKTVSSVCTSYPTWCWDALPREKSCSVLLTFSWESSCDHLSTANTNVGVIDPDLTHIAKPEIGQLSIDYWHFFEPWIWDSTSWHTNHSIVLLLSNPWDGY